MKCLKNNLNWVVSWSVVVAMLFALGCSGTAVSPLGNVAETDVDEIGYAATMGPNGSITVASPPSPRAASAPGDYGVDDSIIEYIDPLEFYMSHIPLAHGENAVDKEDYMYNSEDVFIDHDDFFSYVVLRSEVGTTSFVTYGFRDIPDTENITRIELVGDGNWVGGESSGLYIGIGDPELDTYEWVGPLQDEEAWAVNCPFMDNTNENQRAYVTLLVAGGDEVSIRSMKVFVNGQMMVGEPEMIPEELFDPFPGPWLDDIFGPVLPGQEY